MIVSRNKVGRIVNVIKISFKKGDDLSDFRKTFHAGMIELVTAVRFLGVAGAARGRQIAQEQGQAEKLLGALCGRIVGLRVSISSQTAKTKRYIDHTLKPSRSDSSD